MKSRGPGEAVSRAALAFANELLSMHSRALNSPDVDVLTLTEVANLLRVPEVAVRQLVVSGEIPGRLIGGEWRLLKSTVLSWLAGTNHLHRVRTAGGWDEDAGLPTAEWKSDIAAETWGDETSKEAEEFIQQIRASRQETASQPPPDGGQ